MKIIKGAERSRTEWTTRKLVEMMKEGTVNFDIDIQRGYVWKDNNRKSALIRSLILDKHVPPLYFNKVEDIYEGEDGKQRSLTIAKFLEDEFELSGLDEFTIVNDNGEMEDIDINGYKFSGLPTCFQDAIKEYSLIICFTDNADQSEVADTFYNLNNGQSLNAATMNRVKAKSKEQIIRLGKHKLFSDALTETSIAGHVNEDLVAKSHAILNDDEVSMDTKWIRPYMRTAVITQDDEKLLTEIFDRIYNMHLMIEDVKIAKRIYARTHLISIVPIVAESLEDGFSDKQMMEWFVSFYCGKKSATISDEYNKAAGRGTGKNSAVKIRVEEIKKSYNKYFENMKSLADAS